ncbi:MAG: 3-phosphoshikimate 1-carboxyvinyltransferase [Clostridiales bacterium]|nr:3-phosphoshikimate 1-carboxyvinyltransferase [Clostridiales bacterium]
MILKVYRSKVHGTVRIPGSKSHTIRALFFASLADGRSVIQNPLVSDDAMSAVSTCRVLGAGIDISDDKYTVTGFGGTPVVPDNVIDVGNSGTTLRFAVMTAGLAKGCSVFTGDYQIRRRPLAPLIEAMNNMGAEVFSTRNNGMAPVVVKGRLKGGNTDIDAVTSQFLSSMLINCPLIDNDTYIRVTRLNEAPYVEMTLWWLDKLGIQYSSSSDFRSFHIKGGQKYKPFNTVIPGDFSSASFFMVLAAISGEEFILENLDMSDPQGDKRVLGILENMGAKVSIGRDYIKIKGDGLKGLEIDMNSIPDALPVMAVAGCFAEGETRLLNVPQARLKETDRIHAMWNELKKLGASIEELPDGLVVRKSKLEGCSVHGYDDHRVVMALAVAGLNIDGETVIDTVEAANVTFPEFTGLIASRGGNIKII